MTISEITGKQPIVKMHGIGNDFVVLCDFDEKLNSVMVKKICKRHYGIGADGLVAVLKSRTKEADIRMKFYNPDGSVAEMCGNGIRCFAKYVYDQKIVRKKTIKVDTDAGLLVPEIIDNNEIRAMVKVNMGIPIIKDPKQITLSKNDDGFVKGLSKEKEFTDDG